MRFVSGCVNPLATDLPVVGPIYRLGFREMIIRSLALTSGLATASLMALAAPASAATQIFNFTLDGSSSGLGAGPYGSVAVTEVSTPGGKALDFMITINNTWRINDGNNNHRAFTFSLANNPQVSVTNLSDSRFSALSVSQADGVSAPPFWTGGDVQYVGLDYNGGGSGWDRAYSGPLSFRVMSNSYAVTLNSLVSRAYNNQNVFFTSDLVRQNGNTGNVGAVMVGGAIPEPSAWALLIVGFGAVGGAMRLRRRSQPALAA